MAAQNSRSDLSITPQHLAQLIERHGSEVLTTIVTALRQPASDPAIASGPREGRVHETEQPAAPQMPAPGVPPSASPSWRQVGSIERFEHRWPEVHEHYGPMTVWEGRDERGPVHLAIGEPQERLTIYGRERGWVSVWEVVNGEPRDQRAVFTETDDFEATGERIAVINGNHGDKKTGFTRGEAHLLPAVYHGMRIDLHRDRCSGPYAKNRLGVIASDRDTEVMLNHALAHLRLRS